MTLITLSGIYIFFREGVKNKPIAVKTSLRTWPFYAPRAVQMVVLYDESFSSLIVPQTRYLLPSKTHSNGSCAALWDTFHPKIVENIRQIQQHSREEEDVEARWLVALISNTGMRLSEAAGLHFNDIILDEDIPYINLKPHPWGSLKTKGSQRQIPLVGASLWAAHRLKTNSHHNYAFPRYITTSTTNGKSASAAINKWRKQRVSNGCVIHSFRHSLRAAQCPSDMIEQ